MKAKFDEIFASDKYQNCLKNIKDIAKKHRDELRIEANSLEYLRDDKKTVATKRKELEVKKKKAEELQLEVIRLIFQPGIRNRLMHLSFRWIVQKKRWSPLKRPWSSSTEPC